MLDISDSLRLLYLSFLLTEGLDRRILIPINLHCQIFSICLIGWGVTCIYPCAGLGQSGVNNNLRSLLTKLIKRFGRRDNRRNNWRSSKGGGLGATDGASSLVF